MRLILRRWLSTSLPHTHKLASLRRDVLKKIHPDLFAMSPDAQQTNLACVQGLTDFWSVLSNLMTCIQPGASANTSTISHIKDKYTLSCYVRPNIPSWTEEDEDNNAAAVNTSPSTTEEPKELIHVSYIISVIPKAYSAISQRQPIPKDLLVTTTHSLIFQQSAFLRELDIEDPWEEFTRKMANPVDSMSMSSRELSAFQREVEQRAYDAMITDRMRVRAGAAVTRSVFQRSGTSKGRLKALQAQAEGFIASQRVQVKNLNAEQQLEVLSRLRDFLVNHYDFILFGDAVWGRIIVLLDGSKSSRRDFSLQTVEGFRVIGIPPKFHMRELVDFIHKSIPETAPGFYEAQRAAEL